jgi:hypothetical protein
LNVARRDINIWIRMSGIEALERAVCKRRKMGENNVSESLGGIGRSGAT